MRLKELITCAEGQWLYVFYSGKRTKHHHSDGAPLTLLPPRFSSPQKIYSYFRLYWGHSLAKQMLKNLPLKKRGGKLYVVAWDAGPMSVRVRSCRVLCRNRGSLVVRTKLTGGPEGRVYVVHHLVKNKSGRYSIVRREGPSYDFRYYKASKHIALAE